VLVVVEQVGVFVIEGVVEVVSEKEALLPPDAVPPPENVLAFVIVPLGVSEIAVVALDEDEGVPPTPMVAVAEEAKLMDGLEEKDGMVDPATVGVVESDTVPSDDPDTELVADAVQGAVGEIVVHLLSNPEPVPAALLRETVEEALPEAQLAVALVLVDAVEEAVGDAV
jgi:hypothetical protein